MARLGDQGQVRGVGPAVGKAGGLLRRVRAGERVGQASRALKGLALVVGAVDDLGLGCHGLGLLFRVCDSDEVAVVELGDGVAGGADLGVDLLRGRVFRVLKRGKSKKREREFFCFSFVCSFSSPLSLSPFFFVTKRIINGPGGRGGWPGGRSC